MDLKIKGVLKEMDNITCDKCEKCVIVTGKAGDKHYVCTHPDVHQEMKPEVALNTKLGCEQADDKINVEMDYSFRVSSMLRKYNKTELIGILAALYSILDQADMKIKNNKR
jgi:hypothetical protein